MYAVYGELVCMYSDRLSVPDANKLIFDVRTFYCGSKIILSDPAYLLLQILYKVYNSLDSEFHTSSSAAVVLLVV